MSKYTRYKLYQKYEKRGSQESIPVYPNTYSIDGDGTRPLDIVKDNDPQCGYTGDTQPQYRWYPMPISSYYYCEDCPTQYRWVNMDISTYYECVGTSKYYKQKKQYTYDGTNWYDFVPEETQRGELYQSNSPDCGYIEPQYRTTSGTPYCSGHDKYVSVYSQVSYNGGQTWTTTATTNTMIEHNSQDCGYVPSYSGQYLTFVATESGTFKFSGTTTANTVSYSLDDGNTWSTLARNTDSPTVTAGNKIMWKGTLTPSQNSPYGIGIFSSTNNFTIEGNIMSLLYGDDFSGQTSLSGKYYAFMHLFKNCTKLTSADNLSLPATKVRKYCYAEMFQGCTSLTTVPVLSAATTLQDGFVMTDSCYSYMFEGCTSLTTVPSNMLPATTLTNGCYSYMFANCTSLTTAPELPAAEVDDWSYRNMFSGCTSLTTAPAFSATTIGISGCSYMFASCTSLTTAPVLSATSLWSYCCQFMFRDCTSLTTAPVLLATTLANYCYSNMFNGCTSLTTAPELPATTLADSCYKNMFNGCTSLRTVPSVLLATTLASSCYESMFENCTSLTTAPELPATTLWSYSYLAMFRGCTRLNYIKCLATDIRASSCTSDWVYNIASSGTFYKASSMSSWTRGINGIPTNWNVQDV